MISIHISVEENKNIQLLIYVYHLYLQFSRKLFIKAIWFDFRNTWCMTIFANHRIENGISNTRSTGNRTRVEFKVCNLFVLNREIMGILNAWENIKSVDIGIKHIFIKHRIAILDKINSRHDLYDFLKELIHTVNLLIF